VAATVQIKTHHFLKRDIDSKAIINTDQATKRVLRERRDKEVLEVAERRRHGQEIARLNNLVGEIREDMTEIKASIMLIAGKL
jgi:hypothetical protein